MAAFKKTKKNSERKRTSKRLDGSGSSLKIEKITKKTIKRVGAEIRPRKNTRKVRKVSVLDLQRSNKNPIIEPNAESYWESKATFNPTALEHDGKVHIIYRAIGDTDNSVLGYVKSSDGHSIEKDSKKLAYYHKNIQPVSKMATHINYCSGGGWGGGCEDPRLTLLGDKVYMIYTAFDGWGSVRMALTSISLDDFVSKHFDWKRPVLISPPHQIHKNWVLFPEKINGKYAVLHSISPKIMIDYFKSLDELDGNNFIYSVHQASPLWQTRDRLVRGVGPSPLKTPYGWLVLYHKMDKHENHRYKLWAMILDAKDPTKILYNSHQAILEPDEWYENEGYKGGVVYSCGAVVKDGQLFVYYGGADKVSCVATTNLDKFLEELIHSKMSSLKNKKMVK
ncbi:hypothetical protein A2W67_02835 [Candidatus Nomurabacteria bacterium RIFCSPLOWO2_02_40_28]|nr:MAG: hypothetical protein A2W50_00055 [Candidatus Nomurabacteria bacterium RIFCSPHIGHO2_02_40_30]OGI80319.1 MAG: hypothetical protein A2W43_00235 [Candidatus Nomurabacteria bacterium RIFCSPHIGHO2_12_40_11]OGI95997.1 MAG: hypothetical protein A2W67_02835 [Candidatus Nomurabacteria bacterium RIFCSPLOWO2_02_40_28]OGI98936.1 MAG: hypothetical protein A2W78_03825 [Candidatus Nomurabacteria bacterium RIFCSPLOWO2_12_40_14]